MAENTGISWADSTFNGWIGCNPISPGCDNCYAKSSTPARTLGIVWGPTEPRWRTSIANWNLPRRWNATHTQFASENGGRRRRVFCASLADVFDNKVDPAWRNDLWALIRETPNLDWLLLTKRVGNVPTMLPPDWGAGYSNVWLGISVVNQEEADRDIGKLVAIPAKTRFLSMEPLLGSINLRLTRSAPLWAGDGPGALCIATDRLGIHWVIVGGESGPHARPMEQAWVESLRTQCKTAHVAFFFKQWGGTAKDKGGCQLTSGESKQWPLAA